MNNAVPQPHQFLELLLQDYLGAGHRSNGKLSFQQGNRWIQATAFWEYPGYLSFVVDRLAFRVGVDQSSVVVQYTTVDDVDTVFSTTDIAEPFRVSEYELTPLIRDRMHHLQALTRHIGYIVFAVVDKHYASPVEAQQNSTHD